MWKVEYTKRSAKQYRKLPKHIQSLADLLAKDIEVGGPQRYNWARFSKLKRKRNVTQYHCHLKDGRPTYVACWEVRNKQVKLVEIYYVGTHEKAPY